MVLQRRRDLQGLRREQSLREVVLDRLAKSGCA